MEYDTDNLVKDFFKRTCYNFDLYMEEHCRNPEVYKNEVTMIINSFLGLLVFVQQKHQNDLHSINITRIIDNADYGNDKDEKTVLDFFRHLRNSIAHGNCIKDFTVDENGQIDSLVFRDYHNKSRTFEAKLSIDDIKDLIVELKNIFL